MLPKGKVCELIYCVCQLWTVSVSAINGGDDFGTVPFTLPLVPDCVVCVLGFFKRRFCGNPSLQYFLFYC